MAKDGQFVSAGNALATRDQRDCESRALRLATTPAYAALRSAVERRWRELAGSSPTQEAWARFDTLIDECAFAAVMKAVAGDPARPVVVRVVMPPHDWFGVTVPGSRFGGGPGADQSYAILPIDYGTHYRITGRWFGEPPADHNYTMSANAYFMNSIATMQFDDIRRDADGGYILTVGPEPGGRNHLQTRPGAEYLFIRDCRADWRQGATALAVEALDPPRTPPWSDEQVMGRALQIGLDDAPNMFYWVRFFQGLAPNTLLGPALTDGVGGLVAQTTAFARLVIADDEAVVLTAHPGGAAFHDVQLNDWWFGAVGDYFGRTGSLTTAQMAPNADGTISYVVSREDPGLYNWLDPNGLREVLFVARWQRLTRGGAGPGPNLRLDLVKRDDLAAALPPETRRVDAAGRAAQIEERAATYQLRLAV